MKALCITATASNSGKTILTSSLLYRFKSVRPFKVGPDFIDPQFHKRLCGKDSINLDTYMMSSDKMVEVFYRYAKEFNIIEGAMGFYDGADRGSSTYIVASTLKIPTVVVLDGAGSYITISAILKGLREYREPNPIKAVVLNNLSSKSHYDRIKSIIEKEHPDIRVCGWIRKNLKSLKSCHLGLSLEDLSVMEDISDDVLENIDIDALLDVANSFEPKEIEIKSNSQKIAKKATLVYDENFSFLYYDNYIYLKESFDSVEIVSATKNQAIDSSSDIVIICGGYVESDNAYSKIKDSTIFRDSLIEYVKSGGTVYAECAGLLYLGKSVDDKKMSGILPLEFTLQKRFVRLGYYESESGIKGHAFHYTKPTIESLKLGVERLKKYPSDIGEIGVWQVGSVYGTYLHTFWRESVVISMRNEQ